MEKKRSCYENWAVEHLTGINGEVTPDCSFYMPFHGDDIIIIKSKVTVCAGIIKGLKIAPWCNGVLTDGISLNGG